MIPLVFTVAASTGLPLLYVGLPMLASLSVTHGFLPPHPAPTAITAMFHADLGKTLALWHNCCHSGNSRFRTLAVKSSEQGRGKTTEGICKSESLTEEEMPGFRTSFFSALLPVILITSATIAGFLMPEENIVRKILGYIGNPVIAMLISVLSAIYFLGIARGRK